VDERTRRVVMIAITLGVIIAVVVGLLSGFD
jgi:hypothetical protein